MLCGVGCCEPVMGSGWVRYSTVSTAYQCMYLILCVQMMDVRRLDVFPVAEVDPGGPRFLIPAFVSLQDLNHTLAPSSSLMEKTDERMYRFFAERKIPKGSLVGDNSMQENYGGSWKKLLQDDNKKGAVVVREQLLVARWKYNANRQATAGESSLLHRIEVCAPPSLFGKWFGIANPSRSPL